jgi:hypothetical protein
MGIERVVINFGNGTVEITGSSQAGVLTSEARPLQRSPFPTIDSSRRKVGIKETGIPAGTIDSLRPLMQEVFSDHGLEQDFAYWAKLTEDAPYDPFEACTLLDEANTGPLAAAKAVWDSEPLTKKETEYGKISKDFKGHSIAKLARSILGHYPEESIERWGKEIQDYELALQEQRK